MRLRTWLILSTATLLTGCASIHKSPIFAQRDTAYLTAKSIPPLKIPPGVSSNEFKNYYPISDRHYSDSASVSLIPPGLLG